MKHKRVVRVKACRECDNPLEQGKYCVNPACSLSIQAMQTIHVPKEAKRNPVNYRYDVLGPDFLHCMAEIGAYGAETYGDFNWHKSRLDGEKGPVNHMYKHLGQYRRGEVYDHLNGDRKYHLAAIAFNAMMEFWYLENVDKEKKDV